MYLGENNKLESICSLLPILETQCLEGWGWGRRMKPLLRLMRTDITFSFRLREMNTETRLRYNGIREI
jgi:hypothetical protein